MTVNARSANTSVKKGLGLRSLILQCIGKLLHLGLFFVLKYLYCNLLAILSGANKILQHIHVGYWAYREKRFCLTLPIFEHKHSVIGLSGRKTARPSRVEIKWPLQLFTTIAP